MTGVHNRLPGEVCEVGICFMRAAFTEYVSVIPGDAALKTERHQVDIVLCHQHERQFLNNRLAGTVTAYGVEIMGEEGEK